MRRHPSHVLSHCRDGGVVVNFLRHLFFPHDKIIPMADGSLLIRVVALNALKLAVPKRRWW